MYIRYIHTQTTKQTHTAMIIRNAFSFLLYTWKHLTIQIIHGKTENVCAKKRSFNFILSRKTWTSHSHFAFIMIMGYIWDVYSYVFDEKLKYIMYTSLVTRKKSLTAYLCVFYVSFMVPLKIKFQIFVKHSSWYSQREWKSLSSIVEELIWMYEPSTLIWIFK